MKTPSKSITRSLRGQRNGATGGESPSVSRQRPADQAGMRIPGEGDVCNPPGSVDKASAKHYASATGKHFGGGN